MRNATTLWSKVRVMTLLTIALTGLVTMAARSTVTVTGQGRPSITVKATFKDKPETSYTVQWYYTKNTDCDEQSSGRQPMSSGRIPDVRTDDKGEAPLSFRFTFPPGQKEGAIKFGATDQDGNASSFSLCLPVSAPK